MSRINTDPTKYVVLDVETNGLRSKEDDLLSISFYKPDDDKLYNRYLPLELSNEVNPDASRINGIKKEDLIDKAPLTQYEFDRIIKEFELERRIILIYAGRMFDKSFLREYLRRHSICGFEKLQFYNFKQQIISSSYSGGNVTKDNLCKMFNIENVTAVHSGINDCKLEWELFKKLDGEYYLITSGGEYDNVFRMNSDYIIPVSFLHSHPKIKKITGTLPNINCQYELRKTIFIDGAGISRFDTNINGMLIENVINSMLNVQKEDSHAFLLENKKKLQFVGKIPSPYHVIPVHLNMNGTVTVFNERDKNHESEANNTVSLLKERLKPLVKYIQHSIFNDMPIKSQELVIDPQHNILACCDLSSQDTILEIKTTSWHPEYYKEQLYYESRGRRIFFANLLWSSPVGLSDNRASRLCFQIYEVQTHQEDKTVSPVLSNPVAMLLRDKARKNNIQIISYINSALPIGLRCNVCGREWSSTFTEIMKDHFSCSVCGCVEK